MCKQNYVNLVSVSEQSDSVISICCVFCKNDIPCKGQLTFPICENCRKILGEMVASHKSNWSNDK